MKSSNVNEEELLRTLEDMGDENVSENFIEEFERIAKKIVGQVSTIGITCDTELGKSLRTNDPRREAVMSSVREQTAIVQEIIRTTLGELRELNKQQSDAGVVGMLSSKGIHTSGQLHEFLASSSALQSAVTESCKLLGCGTADLTARIEELVIAVKIETQRASENEVKLQHAQLQVEQLRYEVEHLGKESPKETARMEPLTGHGGGAFLQSSDLRISDGLCNAVAEEVSIPVLNNTEEAMVFKTESDKDMMDLVQPKEWSSPRQRCEALLDILQKEQTLPPEIQIVEKFNDVFAINDRELTQTDLVVREIDTGDNNEICCILDQSEDSCCVVVGPTSEEPLPKKDWCKLASAFAAGARKGMKIVVVAPPRGDPAYERNRMDMNDAVELAKSVAVLVKRNIISSIPIIESSREPSHGPSARPRIDSSGKMRKEY
ncbi:unnamed protein product [Nippostrongylus brasiliensis]|uniref:S ribonuclease n=1 Tax=Nippostrongylus brasiliensis TaxID=27835 RepID=A0A0N4Y6U1_NIPBR|nr:unnamed protein product [Nippostrongylus brasiliensis]